MSTRYSERDYGRIDRDEPRGSQYGRGYDSDYERGYSGRGREGRGFTERAGDEVRSWFGDEEAERRRRMDEQRYGSWGYSGGYGRSFPESYYGRSYSGYGMERSSGENSILVRLSDTDFDVPDDQDIRGRTVIDQNGNEIGKIDDLLMDPQTRRIRFLQVTSGGFLGIGGTMMLIPVQAISRFDRNYVEIDQSMRGGLGAMRYNPPMIDRRSSGGTLSTFSGGFRGRGPRGYKRSDDRIREDVNDRLSDHPLLDASGIDVTVNNGVVTLSGTVNDRSDKRRAEDLALMVPGVADVLVSLAVIRAPSEMATEPTTAARGAAAGTSGATGTRPKSTTT
jgi:osmotically-inducible protein OsmY/sporulation protein YlmC with PRC-barrel domain